MTFVHHKQTSLMENLPSKLVDSLIKKDFHNLYIYEPSNNINANLLRCFINFKLSKSINLYVFTLSREFIGSVVRRFFIHMYR
jgi:hypothetical protein